MNSKFYFLALLAIFSFQLAKAQVETIDTAELRIDYDYTTLASKEDAIQVKEEVFLAIGKKYSFYTNTRTYDIGQVLSGVKTNPNLSEENAKGNLASMGAAIKGMPGAKTHNFSVFKDQKSYKVLLAHTTSTFYDYSEEITFDWAVGEETKEILGYQCMKATTHYRGRSYIAWFAPEIPITEGPYKFHGLPGLILSIQDTANEHHWIAVQISKENVLIEKPIRQGYKKFGKHITRLQRKNMQQLRSGIFSWGRRNGKEYTQKLEDTSAEGITEYLIKASLLNPIELIPAL